jgi:hypothetical protein
MTIVEFLTARLDEDEAIARAATSGRTYNSEADGQFIARFNPSRALAEVKVKRDLITQVENWDAPCGYCGPPTELLGLIAQAYSNHPDYQHEWAQ